MFEELSVILDKQLKIHEELLKLEKEKTKILQKGDIKALDELLNKQQPLIMNSSNLEKNRIKLQEKMGIDLTLKQIIEKFSEAKILNSSFVKMKKVIAQLKKVSVLNNKILNSRIEMLNSVLGSVGVTQQNVIYSDKK